MDISAVGSYQLSNLNVVTPRSQARLQRPAELSGDSPQVDAVKPRNTEVSQRLESFGKIQQAFVSALRMGQSIEHQGLLNPIR